MYRTLTTLIALLAFIAIAFSQQKPLSPKEELEKYFSEAAKGRGYFVTKTTLDEISAKQALKIANPYFQADNSKLQLAAIDLTKRKALSLKNPNERFPFVRVLIEACKAEDSGVSGAASKALTHFNSNDFNTGAQDSILSLLILRSYHFERIIRIAGFVSNQKIQEYLVSNLLNDSTLQKTNKWAVQLALARNGNSESLEYCLNRVKSVKIDDNAVNYLFPDLVYIRQVEAFDYMLQAIHVNEKNCSSGNPYYGANMICAYRIMELIAPAISNFPLAITKHGDLEINDYDKDLKTVREWIESGPELILAKNTF